MGRMRPVATSLVALVATSLVACAPSPTASEGDVLIALDPVPFVLEVPEGLAARLATRPLRDASFAAQAEADGALAAVELVFTADDGTAITFLVAYEFPDEVFDGLRSPDAPPPYGAEILRRDGRVLSVAGPFDLPFEPTTDDAAAWGALYPISRDPTSYQRVD